MVKCCVKNCCNAIKYRNQGVTFHRIPTDPSNAAAWLAALTRLGYRMIKRLVVCSAHFLPEDFDDTRHNQRRVKSGAVPTIMAPVIQEDFQMCRVCLVLDVKMYDMKNYKLSETFETMTGILANDEKGPILQRVCWECAARLKAAAAFRDKALLSDALLKDLVPIKKSDIRTLKQKHTSLNSPLTIHTATATSIECELTILENKETEILTNDDIEFKTEIYETEINEAEIDKTETDRTDINEKEMQFEENEPWIEAPMKTERDSDPLTDNEIAIHDRNKSKKDSVETDSYDSFKHDEDKLRNTKVKYNNNSVILTENTQNNNLMIESKGRNLLADDKKQKQKLVEVTVTSEEDSSGAEDRQSIAEDRQSIADDSQSISEDSQSISDDSQSISDDSQSVSEDSQSISDDSQSISDDSQKISVDSQSIAEDSVSKPKQKKSSKVGASNKNGTVRNYKLNDGLKQKIVAMKKKGVRYSKIAEETGLTVSSIIWFWRRYQKNGRQFSRTVTPGTKKENRGFIPAWTNQCMQCDTEPLVEPGMVMGPCSEIVRERLQKAGLEHILMIKPEENVNTGEKISERKEQPEDSKRRIIALKKKGFTNTHIAYLLNKNRNTVTKWWSRWNKEGHMEDLKRTGRKRKTTPEEDQLIIQRVTEEKSVHTSTMAREFGLSAGTFRKRLKTAGFRAMERKAYVPVKADRSQKVDEELKERIMLMKGKGVSVTEIATQFRVPRQTIYQWWRRWCKENNINTTKDNNTSTSTEQEHNSTEDVNIEKRLETPIIPPAKKFLWKKLPDLESVPQNSELHENSQK